jgi:hypothetical protein
MKSIKSLLRGFLTQFKRLIARYWIAPLDRLLYEIVGLDQSSPWHGLRTAVVWIKDLGRLIYTGFRVNVSRWEGPEWSVIYVSDDSTDSEKELQYLLFAGAPTETKLGRAFMWQLPRLIQRFGSQGCLVVCDMNRLVNWRFQEMYCIRVFPWLRTFLDVSVPMDLAFRRMRKLRKRDLSKAQNLGIEYGCSHELADLELFYHKMYVPYINERYGERATIYSYEGQREVLEKKGELLWVKYQGDPVVAYLGTQRGGKAFSALHLGVHQDYTHLVKQGVITALYWHVISWAHSNRLSVIDFGRVRARLNDGLFAFKRQLGMQFKRDITTYTMWTLIGKDLPLALIRHLNELAFIAEVGKEYRCVVFADGKASLSDEELAQREKITAQAGLDGLLVL